MANSDDEAIGIIAAVVIGLIILYFVIVYIVAPILALTAACGTCIGGFNAVYNYCLAFKANVKPERVTI